jgi:HTH-type transcriptional regulator/antitoxin HigA
MSESSMREFDALCLESAVIKTIESEADYERALARLDELLQAKAASKQGDELDELATLIEAYEKKAFQ